MKKKQLLFLFAAAGLFAACSSDELTDNNLNGGDDSTVTLADDIPSSVAVSTEEGLGMTVGANIGTKAIEDGDDYFTLSLPDDILGDWDGYVAKVDDFYITATKDSNKEILKVVNDGSNQATFNKIKIAHGEDLTVSVEGINRNKIGNKDTFDEFTFEVYIWITNQIEKTYSGADGVYEITVEDFSYTEKLAWIGLDENTPVNKDTERGMDFTDQITEDDWELVKQVVGTAAAGEYEGKNFHYNIRYNVYRGLQGNPTLEDGVTVSEESGLGNTPYIKVTIHTSRIDNPADPDGQEVFPVLPKD